MKIARKYLLSIAALLATVTTSLSAASTTGLVVNFRETDVGTQPYDSRMLVTPDYLRFDDGRDESDFLLFDRKHKVIYNTNSMDKTILVITDQKVDLPRKVDWHHKVDSDNERVPDVGGSKVRHWVLLTNNLVCYDLYAANDLLPEATAALTEYYRVLSTQHAEIYLDMTGVERDACDLANNIYLPVRHLEHGFPIRVRDKEGRSKQMLDYKTGVKLDASLFRLPQGFREFSVSDIRN